MINKVTYLPITSEAADVNRYKAGEIDIVYTVPVNQFAQLKKTLGSQLDVSPQLATYYYEFNTARPPFNDARVRKALNMALDKDIIADKVMGQGQRPAWLISQPDIGGVKLQNPDYAHRVDNIDFSRFIAVHISRLGGDRQICHLVDHGMGIIPVARVTLRHNAFVNYP